MQDGRDPADAHTDAASSHARAANSREPRPSSSDREVTELQECGRRITNRRTLEADLSRTREGMAVRVVVVQ